jgi:hypothetical protein
LHQGALLTLEELDVALPNEIIGPLSSLRGRVTQRDPPDLFWAIRGGGGNFGIVTEFEFSLHAVPAQILAGPIFHTADRAREVLRCYRDFIAGAPDELSVFVNLRTAPDLDWIPAGLRGKPVLALVPCYSGDLDQGERLLRPLRAFGPPAADLVQRKPYLAHHAMFDATSPHGWGYYLKSHYLPPLTDAAVDTLADHAWQAASSASYALLFHLGGQIARRPDHHSAARGRDAQHAIVINAVGTGGTPSHSDIRWCRDMFAALQPHATGGVYVNFVDGDEGQERVRAAYGPRYQRLAQIKARYDPGNIFRANQNIPPQAT